MNRLFENEQKKGLLMNEASKVDIKLFDTEGEQPFKDIDLSKKHVYEFTDFTLRTPIEKADAFYEVLNIPYDCELWVLPVTEEPTNYIKELKEKKTAQLFELLSAVRETIHRDRTFIISDDKLHESVAQELQALGFTLTVVSEKELRNIEISFS
ncbi:hypothetical protein [Heyndrickxia acidicola]|uniref:Uncharacterized protein n=1 Tax=Heyndrickxia acidicola TaxID=209389 RepID=A0ABU6MHB4_9BACI|nr:hypothetical protein [Heyndrickxia acidicola]MED1204064.1 hypothetical protein [Heyndrickxia acidicola]